MVPIVMQPACAKADGVGYNERHGQHRITNQSANNGTSKEYDYVKKLGDLLAEHKKSKCKRPFGNRVPPIKNVPFDPNLF